MVNNVILNLFKKQRLTFHSLRYQAYFKICQVLKKFIQSNKENKKRGENKYPKKRACIQCKTHTITIHSTKENEKNLGTFTILFIICSKKIENDMLVMEYFTNVMPMIAFTNVKYKKQKKSHEFN